MPLEGEYEPSPAQWVRDQVEQYERTQGREANTLRDTGLPIVVFTMRGHKSGKLRKVPLMRVEHDGCYALIASQGGAPTHPSWYHNVKANPDAISVQDGARVIDGTVRELSGEERETWWQRASAAYPPYLEYQQRTERQIPVILFEPRQHG
ncbi:deazaflavin-dependent oxidoreductase (nitroreductase family) [Microlunatus panaciterrae]|uniref:Deazaflavin-dependent oxidoreductase (Nitroreductase family) n=1 Tax=Microlunatus panaciterrae TaxID=400768 RepID=A0ABS2RDZ0_9ACTN|nr:nitroreductase family deazaflavin-dependent oxidoreductase [Microlunatus panaciterrae]MBM7797205.1 deazaflavin-dependent oxidoreductase (nitroreductase family) [Microlunatus panaciterrae]